MWDLGLADRGAAIEKTWGGNLPPGFKTWDRFERGVATSIKSIDLDATGYTRPSAVYSVANRAVNEAYAFTRFERSNVIINASMIQSRVVRIAIPRAATGTQLLELQRVIGNGAMNGITVLVEVY